MLRLQAPLPDGYVAADPDDLVSRIASAKAALGDRVLILGHHYQRDEVMRWADARGDSFRLSVLAGSRPDAEYVVFCGVHFMAESADILTGEHQAVLLPDLNAGCSMADMADIDSVEEAWEALEQVIDVERLVPITYMNSSAALKAFVGRKGGAVCTSTNAGAVLRWALDKGDKVLFFPDQHLGRNTGLAMGYGHDDMRVWDPRQELGGLDEVDCKSATFLLWKGHCSVHQRFRPEHVAAFRAEHPGGVVVARRTPSSRRSRPLRRGRPSASPPRSTSCSGWRPSTRTRPWCRSTPSSARARRCSASMPPTCAGSWRSSSPAGWSTASPSTRRRRPTPRWPSSACTPSPDLSQLGSTSNPAQRRRRTDEPSE
jgi:quinolinate synthetase A subunit